MSTLTTENLSILTGMNNQPTMLHKDAVSEMTMAVRRLLQSDHTAEVKAYSERMQALAVSYGALISDSKPYPMVGSVAVIPVHGVLINKFGWSYGYVTGYNYIRTLVDQAEADPDVSAVFFDISSPGGMVQGAFETSDLIAGMKKPTSAFTESMACSAAYAIAASCDSIYLTESAVVGSVGVVMTHVDFSKMLENEGITVTMLYKGDRKVDMNPYGPLSDEARAAAESSLEKTYDRFTAHVAKSRKIEQNAVIETQAGIYAGNESVTIGFADGVTSMKDALIEFSNGSKTPVSSSHGGNAMANENQAAANAEATATAAAERQRIAGILGCAEAEGRGSLANHLALNTDMSVEAAQGILAASPKEAKPAAEAPAASAPAAGHNAFNNAMANGDHPQVGADSAANGGQNQEMTAAERILAAQKLVSGE